MKIIALLSWYDEPVASLHRCVRSLGRHIGVDRLVAIDGRFRGYPAREISSPDSQRAALRDACESLRIPLVIYQPTSPWPDEPTKRTFLFSWGFRLAQRGDWFLVIDADESVQSAPRDLRTRLEGTGHDVGRVAVHDTFLASHPVPGHPVTSMWRRLFRAMPIYVRRHHSTHVTARGHVLASRRIPEDAAALDVTDLVIDHTPHERPAERMIAKQNYYAIRDASGAEGDR